MKRQKEVGWFINWLMGVESAVDSSVLAFRNKTNTAMKLLVVSLVLLFAGFLLGLLVAAPGAYFG